MKRISSTMWVMISGAFVALTFVFSDYRISGAFLIALVALLTCLANVLLKENFRYAKQNQNRPQIIQFSIARLLLATLVVAFVFGIPKLLSGDIYKDRSVIFIISVIASAFGSLTLVCKKNDFKHILVIICLFIVFFVGVGVIFALMIQLTL
jgi:hypothetical protein